MSVNFLQILLSEYKLRKGLALEAETLHEKARQHAAIEGIVGVAEHYYGAKMMMEYPRLVALSGKRAITFVKSIYWKNVMLFTEDSFEVLACDIHLYKYLLSHKEEPLVDILLDKLKNELFTNGCEQEILWDSPVWIF